jgi:hypothetical protein
MKHCVRLAPAAPVWNELAGRSARHVGCDAARARVRVARALLCGVLLGVCLSSALPAAAQPASKQMPVLLLSPARREANAEWADVARGLRTAGLRAMQVADLPIDPVFAACRQASCAAQASHAAGMPALLCAARGGVLELRWVATDDEVFTEQGDLAPGELPRTTAELARRVLLRRALGTRALLQVESRPTGARVMVDGKLAGLTPFEQAWDPGAHRVSVEREGYEPARADAPLASGAVHHVRVALRAARPSAAARVDESPRLVPSALNAGIGSLLAVASLPLLIAGTNAFIDRGECVESVAGACTHRVEAGAAEAIMLGAGAVSLIGAAYFFIAQPFRLWVEATPRAAALQLRGSF